MNLTVSIASAVHFDVRLFLDYNGVLAGHTVMVEQTMSPGAGQCRTGKVTG
jgi:hypothetical protein